MIHLHTDYGYFDNKVSIEINLPYIPAVNSLLWLNEKHKKELIEKIKNLKDDFKEIYRNIDNIDTYNVVYIIAYSELNNITHICLSKGY